MDTLTELSLFSGYGGFTLGLRLAGLLVQTMCYVEIDGYCQKLIQARIRDGYLDDAPIWDDIRTFDGKPWRQSVDLLTAGFPCQPHSENGKHLGEEDPRNLWPDTLRIIREVEPEHILLENVKGLVIGTDPYSAQVIGDLSEAGYYARWGLLSAAQIGAWHRRERWFCMATNNPSQRVEGIVKEQIQGEPRFPWDKNVRRIEDLRDRPSTFKPLIRGRNDGPPYTMDRLRAIGNGLLPSMVREVLK